jgi:hypothetical protein
VPPLLLDPLLPPVPPDEEEPLLPPLALPLLGLPPGGVEPLHPPARLPAKSSATGTSVTTSRGRTGIKG